MGNYKSLCTFLKRARNNFTIFLGAGASISSGGKSYEEIVFETLKDHADKETDLDKKKDDLRAFEEFYQLLASISDETRYEILRNYFEDMFPSIGYAFLAKIIAYAFEKRNLHTIITTNYDFMLEISLSQEGGLLLGKHYAPYIAGSDDKSFLKVYEDSERLKIIKLHGDIYTKKIGMLQEELQFTPEMKKILKAAFDGKILFIGYSGQDKNVIDCIPEEGDAIFWANPRRPYSEKEEVDKYPEKLDYNMKVDLILKKRNEEQNTDRIFNESDGYFDNFVKKWYSILFPEENIEDVERFMFRKFKIYERREEKVEQWIRDCSRKIIKYLLSSKEKSIPISELVRRLEINRKEFSTIVSNFRQAQFDYDINIIDKKVSLVQRKLNVEEKRKLNIQLKQAIATKCLEKIKSGNIIMLDAGTTTLEISKQLKEQIEEGKLKNIRVVTNSIDVVSELSKNEDIKVICINGDVNPRTLAIVGESKIGIKKILKKNFNKEQANISFIGATGIDIKGGFTNNHPLEKKTKKAMLDLGQQKFIVADHSKFNKCCEYKFASLSKDITIITDHLDEGIWRRYMTHTEIIEAI